MTKAEFHREKMYQLSMRCFRQWLNTGLITEDEYMTLKERMDRKYDPVIGSFFVDNRAA